jgi:hypothetical protein
MPVSIPWPAGKTFAFSIFDDPDGQSLADARTVDSFLQDCGLKITKGVWPLGPLRPPNSRGETCANPEYLAHLEALQRGGWEIGFHNTGPHSSTRSETVRGLDAFKSYFGHDPSAMANHYNGDAIYWGPARLDQPLRTIYSAATLGRTSGKHFGHVTGHDFFWGDICQSRIRYCRNFVWSNINTLASCPWMPYHDPNRPYVNAWYCSSEGSNVSRFCRTIAESSQDRLEAEGGACIMYVHFGHGFVEGGHVQTLFRQLITRLSRMNGWFVPVSTLLDHLRERQGVVTLTNTQRARLERRWLWEKFFRGTS